MCQFDVSINGSQKLSKLFAVVYSSLTGRSHSANQEGEEAQEESSGRPIIQSIFSVSYVVGSYWLFINLFSVVLFATYFNSWINKFSDTKEEGIKVCSVASESLRRRVQK